MLPWHSKSPDSNPINRILDQLDVRVRQREPRTQKREQFRQMLQQKWHFQATIEHYYIESITCRGDA